MALITFMRNCMRCCNAAQKAYSTEEWHTPEWMMKRRIKEEFDELKEEVIVNAPGAWPHWPMIFFYLEIFWFALFIASFSAFFSFLFYFCFSLKLQQSSFCIYLIYSSIYLEIEEFDAFQIDVSMSVNPPIFNP